MTEETRENFPPVDPVEDLSKMTPAAAQELASTDFEEVEARVQVHYETLVNALGTVRAGLAEIAALSTSPSVNTERLGKIAQGLLDGLPNLT